MVTQVHATAQKLMAQSWFLPTFWMFVGAFIAAFAIKIFFIPNNLIDGGTVGLAMIAARVFGTNLFPSFYCFLTFPLSILPIGILEKSL